MKKLWRKIWAQIRAALGKRAAVILAEPSLDPGAQPPATPETPETPQGEDWAGIAANNGTLIKDWPITHAISNARLTGNGVAWDEPNGPHSWPLIGGIGGGVHGTVAMIVERDGGRHLVYWEFIRRGLRSQSFKNLRDDHERNRLTRDPIKRSCPTASEIKGIVVASGGWVGSTSARERSNIAWIGGA